MKYQIVMPFIHRPYMEECLETLRIPRENILMVDNTKENIGVAASWNKGIERMRERGCDWLILLSAAMRFGQPGMLDFIEAISETNDDFLACEPSHGWHCIAIRARVFDIVGTFDENFYPIYFEDTDFGYRCQLSGIICWGSVHGIKLESKGWSHSTKLANVKSDGERLGAFMLKKWGGTRDHYEFKTPFNDPTRTIKDWKKGDIDIHCPL
jgi:GT2 family glycosyltransferase